MRVLALSSSLALTLLVCCTKDPGTTPTDGAGPTGEAAKDPTAAMDAAIAELMAKPELADPAITVQHVLISFAGAPRVAGVTRSKDEAKVQAAKVWAEATSGADFQGLMKTHSNDPGAGEYPMNKPQRSDMVKGFGDVGFRLKVGEIGVAPWHASDSPFGWHVIKRVK